MKKELSFLPTDRYRYDFNICTPSNGFAQIDTSQDASYYGTWANPFTFVIYNYCEGDITKTICEDAKEFAAELRKTKKWEEERNEGKFFIDCLCVDRIEKEFRNHGLGDLFHESSKYKLTFRETDEGYCRVYYDFKKNKSKALYCWQSEGRNAFEFYRCSLDEGEPDYPVSPDIFSFPELPADERPDSMINLLKEYLEEKNPQHTNNGNNTTLATDEVYRGKIRELNDSFRKHENFGGRVVLTSGVANLEGEEIRDIYKHVISFDDFNEKNDPHGEHDFGAFENKGSKFFWKIDYYDKNDMESGSEDPSNPEKTCRVLTVMFASEY